MLAMKSSTARPGVLHARRLRLSRRQRRVAATAFTLLLSSSTLHLPAVHAFNINLVSFSCSQMVWQMQLTPYERQNANGTSFFIDAPFINPLYRQDILLDDINFDSNLLTTLTFNLGNDLKGVTATKGMGGFLLPFSGSAQASGGYFLDDPRNSSSFARYVQDQAISCPNTTAASTSSISSSTTSSSSSTSSTSSSSSSMSLSTFVPPVQQTATVFSTASATPAPLSSSSGGSSSSNVGPIAGGVAGGAVALVALSLLGWLFFKKQKSKRELAEEEERIRRDLANFRDPGTGFDADAALASPELMEKMSYGHHGAEFPSPGSGGSPAAMGAFAGAGAGAAAAYMVSSSNGHDTMSQRVPSTIYPDAPAFYSQAPTQARAYASGLHNIPPEQRPLSYDPTVVAAPYTTLSMVGYPMPVTAPTPQSQQLYPVSSMSAANRNSSMHAPTPVLTSTPAARYAQAGGWEPQQVVAAPMVEGGTDIAPPYSSGPAVAAPEPKGGATGLGRAPTYKTKANSDSSHEDPSANATAAAATAAAAAAAAAAATRDREREARARAYPPRAGSAAGQQRGRSSRGNSLDQPSGSRPSSADANDPSGPSPAANGGRKRTESNASAQSSSSEHSFNIARKPVPRISMLDDEPATETAAPNEDAARSSSSFLAPRPLPPVPAGANLSMPNPHISLNLSEGPHLSLGTDFGNAVSAALAQSTASSSAIADDGQRLSLSGRRRTLPPTSPGPDDAYGGLA